MKDIIINKDYSVIDRLEEISLIVRDISWVKSPKAKEIYDLVNEIIMDIKFKDMKVEEDKR